MYAAYMIFSF